MKRIMTPVMALMLAALFTLLLAATVLAQDDTDASELEPSAYLTLDLQAGFVLDPFLVSLNGGGEVDSSTLDPACVGWINDRPVLTTNWEGGAESLRIFFFSDTDSTLVIQTPDGSYACADDAGDNLLDPELTLSAPMTGTYKLWVGSFDEGHLIPGLLVITARDDVSLTSFDPGTLIKRESIDAEDAPRTEESLAAHATVTSTARVAPDGSIGADVEALTATLATTGTVPAFLLGNEDTVCSGLIEDTPDYILAVDGDVEHLRIFFESDQDTSLVVVSQEASVWCNDEAAVGGNSNPLIDIEAPAPELYGIFVGRFDEEVPAFGTLTVTTDGTLAPAELAPAALQGN